MLNFVKKNRIGVAWVGAAIVMGFVFGVGNPFSILAALGSSSISGTISAYMAFIFSCPLEPLWDYVKRAIPLVIALVAFIGAVVLLKWQVPAFVTAGLQAGGTSIFFAAAFARRQART